MGIVERLGAIKTVAEQTARYVITVYIIRTHSYWTFTSSGVSTKPDPIRGSSISVRRIQKSVEPLGQRVASKLAHIKAVAERSSK